MSQQRDPEVQELIDRQQIYDCMARYCRGADRADMELIRSAYHPDAVDDHGGYVGPREGFIAFAENIARNFYEVSLHHITNFSCEIKGNRAHAEFYLIAMTTPKGMEREIRGGRYVQQYEKRNGKWGIIESYCMIDCDQPNLPAANKDMGITTSLFFPGKKDHSDPSYARPLRVDRKRFTDLGKEAARKIGMPIDE